MPFLRSLALCVGLLCCGLAQAASVVFLNPGRSDEPFWRSYADFMQAAADDLGMDLRIEFAERDNARMLRQARAILQGPEDDGIDGNAEQRHSGQRNGVGRRERQVHLQTGGDGEEAADRHHLAGGEVHHTRGLVDHDEGEPDQRVNRSDGEPAHDELKELLGQWSGPTQACLPRLTGEVPPKGGGGGRLQ